MCISQIVRKAAINRWIARERKTDGETTYRSKDNTASTSRVERSTLSSPHSKVYVSNKIYMILGHRVFQISEAIKFLMIISVKFYLMSISLYFICFICYKSVYFHFRTQWQRGDLFIFRINLIIYKYVLKQNISIWINEVL